jgi:hypothetical protein
MLQVIDPRSRQLLVAQPFEDYGLFVPGTDLLFSQQVDANGITTLVVKRTRLIVN